MKGQKEIWVHEVTDREPNKNEWENKHANIPMNEGIDGWRDGLTHGHNQQWTHERTNENIYFLALHLHCPTEGGGLKYSQSVCTMYLI
jgi:hypothetical protein